jgi:hypothetical protein
LSASSATVKDLLRSMRAGWALVDNQTHPPSYSFRRHDRSKEIRVPADTAIVIAASRAGLIRCVIEPATVGYVVYEISPRPAKASATPPSPRTPL